MSKATAMAGLVAVCLSGLIGCATTTQEHHRANYKYAWENTPGPAGYPHAWAAIEKGVIWVGMRERQLIAARGDGVMISTHTTGDRVYKTIRYGRTYVNLVDYHVESWTETGP